MRHDLSEWQKKRDEGCGSVRILLLPVARLLEGNARRHPAVRVVELGEYVNSHSAREDRNLLNWAVVM
jgi:hypothetical protein